MTGSPTTKSLDPMENPELLFGDINLPKTFMFETGIKKKNGIHSDQNVWPKGIIPYEIDKRLEPYSRLILQALSHYEQNTCLKFKQRSGERDYISFISDSG